MMKLIKATFWAMLLAAAVWWLVLPAYFPPVDASVRSINGLADTHEVKKADETEEQIIEAGLVGGDDQAFGSAIKQFGSQAGQRRADRNAALARATGNMPIITTLRADASMSEWQGAIPFHEPLVVFDVGGQVAAFDQLPAELKRQDPLTFAAETPHIRSGPNGIEYRTSYSRYVLPFNSHLHHLALVGRVCQVIGDPASCTNPFLIGAGRELYPHLLGKTGSLQYKVNSNHLLHGSLSGGYTFSVRPLG